MIPIRSRTLRVAVVLALLVSIGGVGLASAQIVPLGDDFVVNERTAGDQVAPAVSSSAQGQTVALWVDRGERLVARRIGDTAPVGPEIELASLVPGDPVGPAEPDGTRRLDRTAIAADPFGGWLVAWSQVGPAEEGAPAIVFLRRLAADGVPGPVERVGEGGESVVDLRVTVSSVGDAVVSWVESADPADPMAAGPLIGRFYGREGDPLGGPVTLAPSVRDVAAVSIPSGFLFAWVNEENGDVRLMDQIFGRLGNALTSPVRVDERGGERELSPALAVGPLGSAVIVWVSVVVDDYPGYGRGAVLARRLDPTGGAGLPVVRVDVDGTRRKRMVAITALPDSASLVTWADEAGVVNDSRGERLVGRLLGADSRPAGGAAELYSSSRWSVFDPQADGAPDGTITAVWSSCLPQSVNADPGAPPCRSGPDGDGFGLLARRFGLAAAGTLSLGAGPRLLGEDAKLAVATVSRVGGSRGVVTVDLETIELGGGQAVAGQDFEARYETLVWDDGDAATKTVRIPVIEDDLSERDERFAVELSSPTGGAVLETTGEDGPPRLEYTIFDDDPVVPWSNDPRDFVAVGAAASACDGARLAGLLERLDAAAGERAAPVGVNLSLTPTGDFAGIAYTAAYPAEDPATAEHQLAFSTNPEATTLLRNPARPQLVTVGFTRNRLASDLVTPGAAGRLRLVLDPTLADNPDPPADAFLIIDNVERAADGLASDAKPGRGLVPLTEPCLDAVHGPLGPGDGHALRVLLKTLRAETPGAARQEIAIYPAAKAGSYRIDVRAYTADGVPLGRLSAEMAMHYEVPADRSSPARLTGGVLRGLALCDGGGSTACTALDRPTTLSVVRPHPPGELREPSPYRLLAGPDSSGGSVDVDFRDLLGDSTWRAVDPF